MIPSCNVHIEIIGICLLLLLGCGLINGTETDLFCLRSIKNSLKDPLNYLSSSWNFENKTEGAICRFTGVECWHPDENKVLNIKLSDMGLEGQFPLGIRNCSSLTGLDLSSNKLSGELPPDIGTIITFVTTLDLSSNGFSGTIPASLANCSYLNDLKLDNNRLSGQIPPQLGQLGRLKMFNVANNLLTGQIPSFGKNKFSADNFAHNPGLCGEPLDSCESTSKNPRVAVIVGAAVGGVLFAAIAVIIGMFFYFRRAVKMRKKDDDPEENKWARSLKSIKGTKAS